MQCLEQRNLLNAFQLKLSLAETGGEIKTPTIPSLELRSALSPVGLFALVILKIICYFQLHSNIINVKLNFRCKEQHPWLRRDSEMSKGCSFFHSKFICFWCASCWRTCEANANDEREGMQKRLQNCFQGLIISFWIVLAGNYGRRERRDAANTFADFPLLCGNDTQLPFSLG